MNTLLGKALMIAMASGKVFEHIPFFKVHHGRSSEGSGISRSKHKPHQGPHECARRRRQIAAGILKP